MQKAFETIKQLVANFKAQESAYLSLGYQESQIRQDFIDKFFTALGWDVTHNVQMNPYQQEVHIENKVHMAGSQRRADYAFFLAPNFRDPKFFVEAKKPSRNLANPDDYYQTIRYGWNANTPIAVLTDFEEFHILDCRYKPNIKDVMSQKIEYFHYSDYTNEEKFSRIYWLFSREAVASGSLEKRVAELPKVKGKAIKGGYQPVDDAFLEELDKYREVLAKAFKKSNPDLQSEELTEAVQRTIDRLVFIRFLEDKQIEEPAIINLQSKKSAWKGFLELCKQMDPKYNGLVFKPHKVLDGKDFVPPDDEEFGTICRELSDTQSPYNFDQIPISILGSIYERFLGKVVHATDKRVKVEEKPEVRKAGGVYYTPEYIVRYIVNETVGKLIDGKTPKEIADMKFADIACGSGSFLIEVYNQLLDYHIRYYIANPDKQKEADVFERDGKLHLTLKKKKEILLNNVYGVDIDFQATEVTQLSLYLKLLEDVTMHDAHQFGMFKETILPDLRKNIINGNSLIGRDIIDGQLFADIDENKLKPMNFEDAFPVVMKRGGFDAIVGNPPYGAEFIESIIDYLWKKFLVSAKNLDSYALFIEKAFYICKPNGYISYIVPTGWYSGDAFSKLRKFLATNTDPSAFVNLPYDIFKAWVDTTIFVLRKRQSVISWPRKESHFVNIKTFPKRFRISSAEDIANEIDTVDFATWFDDGDDHYLTYADTKVGSMIKRIQKISKYFGELTDIQRGVTPFILTTKKEHNNSILAFDGTVRRYKLEKGTQKYVRFDSSLAELKPERYFKGKRILLRELISRQFRLQAVITDKDFVTNKSMQSILPINNEYSLYYFLGLVNSSVLSFYFLKRSQVGQRDDFPKIVLKETRSLPIRTINFDDPQDKSRHDHIVKLVERMLDAKEKLSNAKTEAETNRLEMQCQTIDCQIDEAVYELYGLTEEEIKIVEGK